MEQSCLESLESQESSWNHRIKYNYTLILNHVDENLLGRPATFHVEF